MANKPLCRVCNRPSPYGNIFCSPSCTEEFKRRRDEHIASLKDAGFEQHVERANVFVRDGVSVTLERVIHVGLDKVIV